MQDVGVHSNQLSWRYSLPSNHMSPLGLTPNNPDTEMSVSVQTDYKIVLTQVYLKMMDTEDEDSLLCTLSWEQQNSFFEELFLFQKFDVF